MDAPSHHPAQPSAVVEKEDPTSSSDSPIMTEDRVQDLLSDYKKDPTEAKKLCVEFKKFRSAVFRKGGRWIEEACRETIDQDVAAVVRKGGLVGRILEESKTHWLQHDWIQECGRKLFLPTEAAEVEKIIVFSLAWLEELRTAGLSIEG